MSGFQSSWLDLREPADRAARDPALLRQAVAHANETAAPLIVDLGCGTGSTARAMAAGLRADARWRLVDHDEALLAIARDRLGPSAETIAADLSDLGALPLEGARLVTASALFDLVSADWIDGFADRLAASGAALYAALSYDGRTEWAPAHPADAEILAAFNRHQHGDKGFGAALGPDAAARLADALRSHGYVVETARSDWRLDPGEAALAGALAEGIAGAATEAGVGRDLVSDWAGFRSSQSGRGRAVVGHLDLFARRP